MRSYNIIVSIFLAFALLFSSSVMAGSESGFYLGGSLGQATVKAKGQTPAGNDFDFNEEDSAYKISGGYNFGIYWFILYLLKE